MRDIKNRGVANAALVTVLFAIVSSLVFPPPAAARQSAFCFDAENRTLRAISVTFSEREIELATGKITVCISSDAAIKREAGQTSTLSDCGTVCFRIEETISTAGFVTVRVAYAGPDRRDATYSFSPTTGQRDYTLCVTSGNPRPACSSDAEGVGSPEPSPEGSASEEEPAADEQANGEQASSSSEPVASTIWLDVSRVGRRVRLLGGVTGEVSCAGSRQISVKVLPRGSLRYRSLKIVFSDDSGAFEVTTRHGRKASYLAVALATDGCVRLRSSAVGV